MAFLETRFDEAVARGTTGGPVGKRTKTYVDGKLRKQNFEWSAPLHRYDLSNHIKTVARFEAIRALFYVVMFTPYDGFRVRDWGDYRATQANTTLQFIAGSTWQLMRRYTALSVTFDRAIKKPEATGIAVWRTRAGAVSAASAAIDSTTGIATISGHALGDTYTWTGAFDVPVTFVNDAMDKIRVDGWAGHELQGLPSILLEELPL